MRWALLRGRDHTALGSIGEAAEERAAAAISRGGALKTYPHTEPNEDCALYGVGRCGVLVAVADGHLGSAAAERSLLHLRDEVAPRWLESPGCEPERWYHEVVGALVEVNRAVLSLRSGERPSRTTLSLALARTGDELLLTASLGDSHVFRVSGAGEAVDLGWPRNRRSGFFLGQEPVAATALAREVRIELGDLADVRAVVAVTDGLSERHIGVTDPAGAVVAAAAAAQREPPAGRSLALARGLVETALEAHAKQGAGDNAAATAMWLAP